MLKRIGSDLRSINEAVSLFLQGLTLGGKESEGNEEQSVLRVRWISEQ